MPKIARSMSCKWLNTIPHLVIQHCFGVAQVTRANYLWARNSGETPSTDSFWWSSVKMTLHTNIVWPSCFFELPFLIFINHLYLVLCIWTILEVYNVHCTTWFLLQNLFAILLWDPEVGKLASPIGNASIDTFESPLIDNYTEKFHVFE